MEALVADNKRDMRRDMRRRFKAIDPSIREGESAAIASNILSTSAYARSGIVLSYMPLCWEVSPANVIPSAIASGKAIAFPQVEGDNMLFRLIQVTASIDSQMQPGYKGILEPLESLPPLDILAMLGTHSLILVPALAYDARGARLGKGGGYYDRYLADLKSNNIDFTTVGVARDCMIVDSVPREEHDIIMDIVVTPTRVMFPPR